MRIHFFGEVRHLILLSAILLMGLITATQVQAGSTTSANTEPNNTRDSEQEPGFLPEDNPGSIIEELEKDAQRKDYLFQFPGVDKMLKPWYDLKTDLYERHGARFGISYTIFYQKASDHVGPEDDAASYDLNIDGAWTCRGRGTGSPTTLGFAVLRRDSLRTDIPPLTLFTQIGSLYSTGAGYSEADASLSELWLQQKFRNNFGDFGFRMGNIFPITAYNYFPFKNFRTDFVDFNHVSNATIPLPDYGLGAFVMYRPRPNVYLRLGAHDANAEVGKFGFDNWEGELFTIFEAGFDPGFMPREPGRPPFGDIHVSIWHQDELDEAGDDDGWGIAGAAMQRFGRFTPFLRYGYADGGANGPTPAKHMANVGLVIDGIFGQANDRIGVGYTWSDPADQALDDQSTIDAYYRVQVTPEIAVSPTLQVIFDPVRNPDEDTVYVWGIRSRIEF